MTGSRAALLVQAAALAVVPAGLLVAVGLPIASAGVLSPARFLLLVAAVMVAFFLFAVALLLRAVGRPVERLLGAARRLERGAELPVLGPPGDTGGGLSRAAVAFERTAAALEEERARLSHKLAELQRTNLQLASAREQLLRSERLAGVGLLAAGVAHEIGNPLGAVTGYADLARQKLQAGKVGEADDFLVRIAADARRIDAIVRELLDLARPERVALSAVSIAPVLEEAIATARVQERFGEVRVEVASGEELPPVWADPRRLSQVLLNVLLNAADAMGGRGTIRIASFRSGEEVELRVADEGPGIAPEHLPRIFDPFFSTKAPGRGTGLGLAVCHALMERFGGSISAEAGEPRGALFRLRLRAAGAGAGAAGEAC